MDKVFVEVYVPVLSQSFDMFLPLYSPMYEVFELIKKAITDISDGRFVAQPNTVLCYREDGIIININLSVYDLEIRNGAKLMLI